MFIAASPEKYTMSGRIRQTAEDPLPPLLTGRASAPGRSPEGDCSPAIPVMLTGGPAGAIFPARLSLRGGPPDEKIMLRPGRGACSADGPGRGGSAGRHAGRDPAFRPL